MNKTNQYILITLLFFAVGNSGFAQSKIFDLNKALHYAKDNSPLSVIIEKRTESADQNYKAYRASLLPQLMLNGNLPGIERSINSITQNDGSIRFVPQSQAFSTANIGFSQNITPLGSQLYLSSGLSRIDIFNTQNPNQTLWQASPLIVGYSQPIWRFNDMKWDRKSQELNYVLTTKRMNESQQNMYRDITRLYFELYLLRESRAQAQYNYEINDSLYILSKGRYNVGKISENDLLQIELNVMKSKNNLEIAKTNAKAKAEQLKLVLGYPINDEINVIPPLSNPKISISEEEVQRLASENNPNLIRLKVNRLNALIDKQRTLANTHFNGNLNVSFGLNQSSPNFDEAYNSLLDRQSVSVGFTMPVFTWGKNKSTRLAARNEYEATIAETDLQVEQLKNQIRTMVAVFNQNSSSLKLSAKADTIAMKRYEVARNRYLIGKIGISDLYIAQNEKDNARRSYLNALQNYWISYFEIRSITMHHFGILEDL